MQKDIITFRGKRDLWIDFVHRLRKERKQVWQVMEKWIKEYLKK